MFRALLCPSSGAFPSLPSIPEQDWKQHGTDITRWTEAACAVKERLLMMVTIVPETCWAVYKWINKHLLKFLKVFVRLVDVLSHFIYYSTSSLLYRAACCFNLFFIVPTHALHYTFKCLNLTPKHLKFAPTCFSLLWNQFRGGPWPEDDFKGDRNM
jgi:hypothetical protein